MMIQSTYKDPNDPSVHLSALREEIEDSMEHVSGHSHVLSNQSTMKDDSDIGNMKTLLVTQSSG